MHKYSILFAPHDTLSKEYFCTFSWTAQTFLHIINFGFNLGKTTEKLIYSNEDIAGKVDPLFDKFDTNFDGLLEYYEISDLFK